MNEEFQPPNDQLAEQATLGSMLMSKHAVAVVPTIITGADFYRPNHQYIYEAILGVVASGESVDPVTVAGELDRRGQLKKVGGPPFLLTLVENTPTPNNADSYAKAVQGKAKLRGLAELGVQLSALAYQDSGSTQDVDRLLSEGESLFRAQHQADDKALSFDDMVASWETWQASAEGYIRTPWAELNAKLNGGLQRGRVYTFGARPGVGKSVAALQIAQGAAKWGFKSAVFSLEMGRDEVTSRMLACGAGADFSQIMRKNLDLENRAKVDRYLKESAGLKLQVIDRSRITVEQIVAHCRSVGDIDVLVVDYLQLMTASDNKAQREQQVAHFSRSLKIAAKELNVAVILCSQLNRGSVKDGKPRAPTIADLRESGAVEQDSDVVILLHNDEDDPGIIQFIVGKNRNGKMGDLVLNFEGHYQRIS